MRDVKRVGIAGISHESNSFSRSPATLDRFRERQWLYGEMASLLDRGRLGMEAEVKKITDIKEFAKAGVIFTPAIVVDGKLMISGKVPSVDEIKKILE